MAEQDLQDFRKRYEQEILPAVQDLERSRGRKRLRCIVVTFLACVLWLLLASFLAIISEKTSLLDILATKPAAVVSALICCIPLALCRSFEDEVKGKVISLICESFGDVKWSSGEYVGDRIIRDSGVLTSSYMNYDDVFQLLYKDVKVDIVEARYRKSFSKQYLNAVVVVLDMDKWFNGHTVLTLNEFLDIPPKLNLKRTEFEDEDFNQKFCVYTNDGRESRHLLTPAFMEKVKAVKQNFAGSGGDFGCAFFKNYFLVAIPMAGDSFHLGSLFKSLNDYDQYLKLYKDLKSIVALVDFLKLHQK